MKMKITITNNVFNNRITTVISNSIKKELKGVEMKVGNTADMTAQITDYNIHFRCTKINKNKLNVLLTRVHADGKEKEKCQK